MLSASTDALWLGTLAEGVVVGICASSRPIGVSVVDEDAADGDAGGVKTDCGSPVFIGKVFCVPGGCLRVPPVVVVVTVVAML